MKEYKPLEDIKGVMAILNRISIFGGLSEKQLRSIFKLLKKVSYSEGEYIFKIGDEPGEIYIVKSGTVKLVDETDEGILELAQLDVGEIFGETSVIGIQPHEASAIAVEDTELIVLSRGALLSIFDTDKELFGMLILNLAREVSRRLHQADETLLHYVLKK